MDRGQYRRLHQPGVAQRHKVVVAVDQVELPGMLKGFRDVQVFGYLGIDGTILLVTLIDHRMEPGAGDGVTSGEERHLPASSHQPFGDVAGHGLPGAILSRWGTPCNRR